MAIVAAILLTLLAILAVLLVNERIQRQNLEERNRKLRKNLRRSNV